jgi:lipid-binding SYLF domain-containing protein
LVNSYNVSESDMRKTFITLLLFVATASVAFADEVSDTVAEFRQATGSKEFFNNAYAYAVLPTVGKGAILVGGGHGKGVMFQNGSRVGTVTLNQISVGLQVGGQKFSQIVFIQNKKTYDNFIAGGFEFGAQASAVAVRSGVNASSGTTGSTGGVSGTAGTDLKGGYTQGVAVFIISKGGLMVEGALAGQTFSFKPD